MSILAAPRYKKRISVDPQNVNWARNENKFGQKLMQTMGWEAGKGLGSNNQGRTDNLKLDANFTAKGLGFTGNGHEKTWIAHHDEFSALLGKLKAQKAEKKEESEDSESESEVEEPAKKKAKTEGTSMEERSRNSTKRLHYKYTKMKDLSRYSAKDKAAVIGVGLKSVQVEPKAEPVVVEEKPTPAPEQHKDSVVSVKDYFAAKMAAFYAKKHSVQASVETVTTETSVTIVETDEQEYPEENANETTPKKDIDQATFDEEAERLRRKAEKKARKAAEREAAEKAEEERLRRKAEKKARKAAEREAAAAAEAEEERLRLKAEKKERKRKAREAAALEE